MLWGTVKCKPTLHKEMKAFFNDAEWGTFAPEAAAPEAWPASMQPDPRFRCTHRIPWAPLAHGTPLHLQYREGDCRMRTRNGPTVMGILRQTTLNMVRSVQPNFEPDVSISLLRDRIGCQLRILVPSLP